MSNRMKWIGVIGMFCWFVCGLSLGFNFGLKRGRAEQAKIDAAHPVVKEVPSEPIACPSPEVRVTTAGAVSSVWMCSTFVPAPAPPAKPTPCRGRKISSVEINSEPIKAGDCFDLPGAKPAKGSKRQRTEYERGYEAAFRDLQSHSALTIPMPQVEQDKPCPKMPEGVQYAIVCGPQPVPEKEPQALTVGPGKTCSMYGSDWFYARADGKCYAADAPAGKP